MLYRKPLLFLFLIGFLSQTASAQKEWFDLQDKALDSVVYKDWLKHQAEEAKQKHEEATQLIEQKLSDPNTTTLTLYNFPAQELDSRISALVNLEELHLIRCRALDLDKLFALLGQLPKLRLLELTKGAYPILPASVGNLSSLTEFIFKDNNIKTLPESFTKLSKLRVLNVEHCAYLYDDEVYDRLQKMNVEELAFSASGLFEINSKISSVSSLKRINYAKNDIKVLPEGFNKLNNLVAINLSENLKLDLVSVCKTLVSMKHLQELDLNDCNLETLPLEIGTLVNLTTLRLSGNRISALPIGFTNLVNLEVLDFSNSTNRANQLTQLGTDFGSLKKLKQLNLAGNLLTTLPADFAELKDLENLNLSTNQLSEIPLSLCELTKLKYLNLNLNNIHLVPEKIGQLDNLETLLLQGNYFNKPEKKIKSLPSSIYKLTKLKTLDLNDNTIEEMPNGIEAFSQLETLELRNNLFNSLPPNLSKLTNLRKLDVKANELKALPADIIYLNKLEDLNVAMNLKIDFNTEIQKFYALHSLKTLDISFNNISRNSLQPLRSALPNCQIINQDFSRRLK